MLSTLSACSSHEPAFFLQQPLAKGSRCNHKPPKCAVEVWMHDSVVEFTWRGFVGIHIHESLHLHEHILYQKHFLPKHSLPKHSLATTHLCTLKSLYDILAAKCSICLQALQNFSQLSIFCCLLVHNLIQWKTRNITDARWLTQHGSIALICTHFFIISVSVMGFFLSATAPTCPLYFLLVAVGGK